MKIEAVILDCDGTMFDSERIWWDLWYEVGAAENVVVSENFLIDITGASPQKEASIQKKYPEILSIMPLVREKGIQLFNRIIEEKVNIQKKGLHQLIDYLHNNKIKIAVVSNSSKAHVHGLIQTTDYAPLFDVIVCREDVTHGKPNPEGLLKAAAAMNVNKSNCLVIEDSKLGSLAAKNADMHRIYIKDLVPKDEELESYIEFELSDLLEVISFLEQQ